MLCKTCSACVETTDTVWMGSKHKAQFCDYARTNPEVCSQLWVWDKCTRACNSCCEDNNGTIPFTSGSKIYASFIKPENKE